MQKDRARHLHVQPFDPAAMHRIPCRSGTCVLSTRLHNRNRRLRQLKAERVYSTEQRMTEAREGKVYSTEQRKAEAREGIQY